jgi:phage baseplate assembly protein W
MDAGSIYGRGISFPPRVGPDGRIAWSDGPQNVRECIQIILLTEPRERLNLRDFGGGLGQLLFEPNTVTTHQLIRERILRALARWEPRVAVEDVQVEPDPDDPESAVVEIVYRLVATQAREQIRLGVALRSSV